jgi:hypothetical protein
MRKFSYINLCGIPVKLLESAIADAYTACMVLSRKAKSLQPWHSYMHYIYNGYINKHMKTYIQKYIHADIYTYRTKLASQLNRKIEKYVKNK